MNRQTISLLNLLLASWFMQECIDELRETNVYRHTLKQKLNGIESEIHPIIDRDLNLLWGVDDEAMYNLLKGLRKFIEEFASVRPEQIAGFAELMAKYRQMPEWTLRSLGVRIVESEKEIA